MPRRTLRAQLSTPPRIVSVRQGVGLSLALAMVGGVACSNLLGLEERKLDPTFDNGGNGGTGGSAGTAGTGGTGGTANELCDQYCDEVLANCTGQLVQYPNREQCLAICAAIPVGDGPNGNTMTCRLQQAISARTSGEPVEHCAAAGPGGANATGLAICGSNCEGYCGLMEDVCPDAFGSVGACLQECSSLPDLGGFNSGIDKGNSVQCRLWHVSAATQAVFPHCEHAAGAQPCDPGTPGPGGSGGGGAGGTNAGGTGGTTGGASGAGGG